MNAIFKFLKFCCVKAKAEFFFVAQGRIKNIG